MKQKNQITFLIMVMPLLLWPQLDLKAQTVSSLFDKDDSVEVKMMKLFKIHETTEKENYCLGPEGCVGCANENYIPGEIIINMNDSLITHTFFVDRVREWGDCHGTIWDNKGDKHNAVIITKFKLNDGQIQIKDDGIEISLGKLKAYTTYFDEYISEFIKSRNNIDIF